LRPAPDSFEPSPRRRVWAVHGNDSRRNVAGSGPADGLGGGPDV